MLSDLVHVGLADRLGPLWGCHSLTRLLSDCAWETLSSIVHRTKPGSRVLRDLAILMSFARVICLSLGAYT